MLPARQLSVFVLCSSACALLIALSGKNAAVRTLPTEQDQSALTVKASLAPVVVTEYHPQNQPTRQISGPVKLEMDSFLFNWKIIEEPADAIVVEDITEWRVASEKEIPFPLYPNGTRYRIGGEQGMKIALFETTDDFSKVDAYYDQQAATSGLARKQMTQDYVQYVQPEITEGAIAEDSPDQSSAQPGVVIHEFFNADEALKLGAAPESRTNIIISFR